MSEDATRRVCIRSVCRRRQLRLLLLAAATALTGFVLHVLLLEGAEKWVRGETMGLSYPLSVTLLAALSSIENGVGVVGLCVLLHAPLSRLRLPARMAVVTVLLLAIKGSLLRQLLMDLLLAGPGWPVLVHDASPWLLNAAMSCVAVYGVDRLLAARA